MAGGLFSKGGGVPLTPAQQQLQSLAVQQSQDFGKVWEPVQGYLMQQAQANAPGLRAMAQGQAATSAKLAGSGGLDAALLGDSARGAGPGSGKFLSDLGGGMDALAGGTGSAMAQAGGMADMHYAQALQQVLGMTQQDQSVALHGLETAANAQAQEAGATVEANQQGQQELGQMAGLAIAAF